MASPSILLVVLGPQCKCYDIWRYLEESKKLIKVLEGTSYEEGLWGCLGFPVWRKVGQVKTSFSAASWGGEVQNEMLYSTSWSPVTGHMGMPHSCARGCWEKYLYHKGGPTLEQASLKGDWCPISVSVRDVWVMFLIVCFNFYLTAKWLASWTRLS